MFFGPKKSLVFLSKNYVGASLIAESPKTEENTPKRSLRKPLNGYLLTSLVQKFIRNLKRSSGVRSLLSLQKLHEINSIITDNSFVNLELNRTGLIRKKLKWLQETYKKIIISPENPLRIIWSHISLLIMVACFFYVPFEASFGIKGTIWFDYLIFFIFFSDSIFNIITGTFIKGLLMMEPVILFKRYFKREFFLDTIALISPISQLLLNSSETQSDGVLLFYKFFVFGKFPRFLNHFKALTNHYKFEYRHQNIVELLKLLFYSLFLAHFLACLWHSCAFLDIDNNWLISYDLKDKSNTIQYVYSLYWTIVTMMTVGYGDITPQNEWEVVFSIVAIIFGCGLYAFNLNSIGIILQKKNEKKTRFKHDLRIINNFMDRKNIDVKLQRRVQEYLNFLYSEQNSQNNEEESLIINKLSNILREELLLESYGGIFLNSPLFVKNFSEISLRKIVKIIKEVKMIPGDEIFEEDALDDCSLYFINKGNVELYLNRTDNIAVNKIKVLKKGDMFGEYSFFTGLKRDFSCKCTKFTSLLIINREQIIKILKENESDYERFSMIKDEILMANSYSLINMRCFHCRSPNHTIKFCPLLHYLPNFERVIKKSQFSFNQSRMTFKRKSVLKKFSHFEILEKAVKIYSESQTKEIENIVDDDDSLSENDSLKNLEKKNTSSINQLNKSNEIPNTFETILINETKSREMIHLPRTKTKKKTAEEKEFLNRFAAMEKQYQEQQEEQKPEPPEKKGMQASVFSTGYSIANRLESTIPNHLLDFEKIRVFQNYYPQMNAKEILNAVNRGNSLLKHFHEALEEKGVRSQIEQEIKAKVMRFQNYSIYFGIFKSCLLEAQLKNFAIKEKRKEDNSNPNIEKSPYFKKKRQYEGFFQRKTLHMDKEKNFKSLVNMLVEANKSKRDRVKQTAIEKKREFLRISKILKSKGNRNLIFSKKSKKI